MAPASPATLDYMRRYTAGFSGTPDLGFSWSSVAEYLALFERRVAVNIAYLIPNGNLRMEVMGFETRPATADELRRMGRDRKSTRLNSSHANISYAVFCLKKK